jgi:hypothetical protein
MRSRTNSNAKFSIGKMYGGPVISGIASLDTAALNIV